ncbi:hypothetical protein BUE93_01580 [Chromobacterium amazonense]|uniref:Uncharacterized protein n=1 Tax=Chromobacterium amazonense TaxID=1382803 RepID=A0A2S9X9P0_9NEIS|nr:interleukin-like EMT inducer domain-containing protein [Chromobacterium amazonense]PRP72451.1 hypothetical protein BUE93_01580 [Chromobacterium amazonense]
MANLQEKPAWEAGIYQLETSDPVLGGPDGIDNLQAKQLANRTVFLKKQIDDLVSGALTAEYADRLKTPRNIAMTGDGSWNVTFDASGNVSAAMTLSNSGVTAGSYGQVTVDAKGRVTAARAIIPDDVPALDWSKIASGKPTTLAGYGIADGASKSDLQSAVNGLVSNAPANLNTLQELAASINNDPKYSATVDGKLAGKADKTDLANAGIGGQARNINAGALTDLRPNGFYHAQADGGKGVTGAPGNGANGVFNVNFLSDKWGSLTYRQWGGEIYEARLENGAWSSFNRHWHSGNFNPDGKADKATTLAGYGITDGASKTDLKTAIDGVVAGAPGALNTLQELAAALGNDSNYAATITKQLSGKADRATTLAGYGITDAVPSAQGMMLKGTVDQTQLDTVFDPGFRAVNRSGFTSTLVTMNAGGSVGPFQLEAFYSGDLRWRNQTDSKIWNNWKGIWHSGNFRPDDKADKASTLAGYGILDAVGKNDFSQLVNKVASRKLVRVRATGYAVPNRTSYLEVDGIVKSYGARSYNMAQLDKQGNVTRDAVFDVAGGNNQGQAAADWLNAVPDGTWVIVYTSDEPQWNRDPDGSLGKALYRCGASRQVFGSSAFFYRSAYILIGQAGCGEGKGREFYRGDGPSSPNSELNVSFDLINGEPVLPVVATGSASFGASGYQRLPSGLIVQWNAGALASQGGVDGVSNNFPIAFPNACLIVLAVHWGTDASVNVVVQGWDNNSVRLRSNYSPAGAGVAAPYLAIGY